MINRVILVGRAGADPKIITAESGIEFAAINLAVNKKNKDKEDITTWIPLLLFGARLDIARQYVSKGQMLYVEGEISIRAKQVGEVRYKETSIIVNQLTILSPKATNNNAHPEITKETLEKFEELDDDMPF